MGTRGPVPKRKSELNGHRSNAELAGETVTRLPSTKSAPGAPGAKQPPAPRDWSKSARRLWKAAGESAQASLAQPSDWAMLHLICTELTEYQNMPRRSANMFAAIMSGLTSFGLTEGDRRRLLIEVNTPDEETVSPGAEEVEKWLSQMSRLDSPTSADSD